MTEPVICRHGPWHKRVFHAEDFAKILEQAAAAGRPAPYVDTGEFKRIGDVHHYGLKPAQADQVARVWLFDESLAAEPTRPRGSMDCTFLGCGERATRRIVGETGATWLGCDAHWSAMSKAFSLGQRIDYPVTVTSC